MDDRDHPRMRRWVDQKLGGGTIDDVFVSTSGMARYVMRHTGARRVLDMADFESGRFAWDVSRAAWRSLPFWSREGRGPRDVDRRSARNFDRILFVSAAESARFLALAPECGDRVGVVENGVDLAYFSPTLAFNSPFTANSVQVVFTGPMDAWPNVDAMTWFARDIMPLLLARAPGAHLTIVGANPVREVRALAGPHVTVTGQVDDMRPYVAHAAVVIAPLRAARGPRDSVLEAMAMGRPVVASPRAYEGLRAAPGRDLLVADGARDMAQAVVDVLDARHIGLSEAARRAVERGYGWPVVLDKLDALIDQDVPPRPALAHGAPRP